MVEELKLEIAALKCKSMQSNVEKIEKTEKEIYGWGGGEKDEI